MALRTFETDTARYYLGLGRHDTSSAPIFENVDLGSLDFMILESGSVNNPCDISSHRQYENLLQRFHKENEKKVVYDVDYNTGLLGESTSLIKELGLTMGSVSFPYSLIPFRNGNWALGIGLITIGGMCLGRLADVLVERGYSNRTSPQHMNSLLSTIFPVPDDGFRDALVAKKTAEYLVPKHKHQDGSKVQVGILYGAMHSGIETKLKHPWVADATLWMYHDLFGYGDTEKLNEVREIVPGQEEFVKYDCGLFK